MANFTGAGWVAGYGLRVAGYGLRVAGCGLRVFRFRIVSIGDLGLRISDLMAKCMAHKNS